MGAAMGYLHFFRTHARFLIFGLLLTLSSNCGQTFFIALFGSQLRAELGLSDGYFGFLYSAATLTSALILPSAGRWIDKIDLRLYSLAVYGGLILGCFTMSWVRSIPLLFVAVLLLRLFGQGLLGHTASTSMARYFEAGRGKAMSLASLGYPAGEAVFPLIAVAAVESFGWRMTWQVTGFVALVIVAPAIAWLLRGHEVRHRQLEERLEVEHEAVDGGRAQEDPRRSDLRRVWTRADVLRDPCFHWILPVVLAPPFIGTGVFFHQTRICEAKGWPHLWFAASFAVYASGSVLADLYGGALVARFRARRLVGGYLIPQAIALVALASWDDPIVISVYMVGAGFTAGVGSPVIGALWAELYGVMHLGAIRSTVTSVMVFSTALAPGPIGWLIGNGVSIESLAWAGAGGCAVLSLLAVIVIRRYQSAAPENRGGVDALGTDSDRRR